jgi:ankyrin repeat protein
LLSCETINSKLIAYGVPIDAGITCTDHASLDERSPLMIACEQDNISMVEILLNNNSNLLHVTASGESVLMRVISVEVLNLIVEKAIQQHCLNEVLDVRDCNGLIVHQYADGKVLDKINLEEIQLLHQYIKNTDEKNTLLVLRRLHVLYDSSFNEFIKQSSDFDRGKKQEKYNILDLCVMRDFTQIVLQCIAWGISMDDVGDKKSPLIIACGYNKIELVKIILKQDVNLLHVDSNGRTALMFVQSKEILALMLAEAVKQDCFDQLIAIKDIHKKNVYDNACMNGNYIVLNELMQIKDYHQSIDIRQFLNEARSAYWRFPEKSAAFNAICLPLRELIKHEQAAKELRKDACTLSIASAHHTLFGSRYISPLASKEEAVKSAISQFHALLSTPLKCIQYLQFLNQEFSRYYREKYDKAFPSLDPDSYEFRVIDRTYYPVPKENYVKLKKCHALEEYLMALFNKHGLGKNAYKWIGFIPHKIADAMVANGDMLIEDRLGSGLFHGKLSHMLQRALLIFAIENDEINLKNITIDDILNGLVTINQHNNDHKLWMPVRDTRHYGDVSFTDPHRLGSVIMRDGRELGMTALSDSLVDTFCNGLTHLLAVYQKNTYFAQMDLDQFVEYMDDMLLALFDIPPYVLQDSLNREIKKGRIPENDVKASQRYAVIPKHYAVNQDFEPQRFKI